MVEEKSTSARLSDLERRIERIEKFISGGQQCYSGRQGDELFINDMNLAEAMTEFIEMFVSVECAGDVRVHYDRR